MKAIVVVAALAGCGRGGGVAATSLVDVKRGDLVLGVAIEGELEAVDSTDIKPPAVDQWDFKIAMLAPEGVDIKEGQPVAGFDTSDMERELEGQQNEVRAAQTQLEKKGNDARLARKTEELAIAEAEANVRKAELKLAGPEDLTSSIERKTLALDAEVARVALEQAKTKAARQRRTDETELAALAGKRDYAAKHAARLEDEVAKMVVKAPRAGTIVYPAQWNGDKLKVGDQTWRLGVVLQVVGLGKMRAKGRVDEVDIARVALKQPLSLRLDALPDVQLRGSVDTIAKAVVPHSQTDPSKVIEVRVALDPTTAPLRPGMRFRGEIETARVPDVVQVPVEAVFVTPSGPVAYRATASGALEAVKLGVGRRSARAVEVTAGLAAGDRVSRVEPARGGGS